MVASWSNSEGKRFNVVIESCFADGLTAKLERGQSILDDVGDTVKQFTQTRITIRFVISHIDCLSFVKLKRKLKGIVCFWSVLICFLLTSDETIAVILNVGSLLAPRSCSTD